MVDSVLSNTSASREDGDDLTARAPIGEGTDTGSCIKPRSRCDACRLRSKGAKCDGPKKNPCTWCRQSHSMCTYTDKDGNAIEGLEREEPSYSEFGPDFLQAHLRNAAAVPSYWGKQHTQRRNCIQVYPPTMDATPAVTSSGSSLPLPMTLGSTNQAYFPSSGRFATHGMVPLVAAQVQVEQVPYNQYFNALPSGGDFLQPQQQLAFPPLDAASDGAESTGRLTHSVAEQESAHTHWPSSGSTSLCEAVSASQPPACRDASASSPLGETTSRKFEQVPTETDSTPSRLLLPSELVDRMREGNDGYQ